MLEKWIEALRSGKYMQTSNRLVKVDLYKRSYCCLGVACVVAGLEEESRDGNWFGFKYKWINDYGQEEELIEESVLPSILENAFPTMLSLDPPIPAIQANDRYRLPFCTIADILESVYLGDGTKAKTLLEKAIKDYDGRETIVSLEGLAELKESYLANLEQGDTETLEQG